MTFAMPVMAADLPGSRVIVATDIERLGDPDEAIGSAPIADFGEAALDESRAVIEAYGGDDAVVPGTDDVVREPGEIEVVSLEADAGDPIENTSVTLDSGETKTVTLAYDPGTVDSNVSVQGVEIQAATVSEDGATGGTTDESADSREDEAMPTDGRFTDELSGFGFVAAGAGVGLGVLLMRRLLHE